MSAANQPPAKKPSAASMNGSTRAVRRKKAELLSAVDTLRRGGSSLSTIGSKLKLNSKQVNRYLAMSEKLRGGEKSPIGDNLRNPANLTSPDSVRAAESVSTVSVLINDLKARVTVLEKEAASGSRLSEDQMRTVLELAARVARQAVQPWKE